MAPASWEFQGDFGDVASFPGRRRGPAAPGAAGGESPLPAKLFETRAGHFKVPVGLERLTAARRLDFVLRPPPSRTSPRPRLGSRCPRRRSFSGSSTTWSLRGRRLLQLPARGHTGAGRLALKLATWSSGSFAQGDVDAEEEVPGVLPRPRGRKGGHLLLRVLQEEGVEGTRRRLGSDLASSRARSTPGRVPRRARAAARSGTELRGPPGGPGERLGGLRDVARHGGKKRRRSGRTAALPVPGAVELGFRYDEIRYDGGTGRGFAGVGDRSRDVRPAAERCFTGGIPGEAALLRIEGNLMREARGSAARSRAGAGGQRRERGRPLPDRATLEVLKLMRRDLSIAAALALGACGGGGGSSSGPSTTPTPTPTSGVEPGPEALRPPHLRPEPAARVRIAIDPSDWAALQANSRTTTTTPPTSRSTRRRCARWQSLPGSRSRSGVKPALKSTSTTTRPRRSTESTRRWCSTTRSRTRPTSASGSLSVSRQWPFPLPQRVRAPLHRRAVLGPLPGEGVHQHPLLKARRGEQSGNLFDYQYAFPSTSPQGEDPGDYVAGPFEPQTTEPTSTRPARGLRPHDQRSDPRHVHRRHRGVAGPRPLPHPPRVENSVAESYGIVGRLGTQLFTCTIILGQRRFVSCPGTRTPRSPRAAIPSTRGSTRTAAAPARRYGVQQTYIAALRRTMTRS